MIFISRHRRLRNAAKALTGFGTALFFYWFKPDV